MLTELELNTMADTFQDIYEKVSERVMAQIGRNVKRTMDLTPSQAKAIQQMHIYGADMGKLDGIMKQTSGKSFEDMKTMYEYAVKDSYTWAKPFYEHRGLTQIPTRFNQSLKQMLNAIAQSSGKELTNLSRTTTIGIETTKGFEPLGKFYKDTINKSILAASTGSESYQKAVRNALQELGGSGLRVQYESGYTRRIDSAVRQNVLDGMSYIAQESAKIHGEAFGADGWELSAHSPCAPDHLPYQGLQYSKAEYEDLQASLKRPIGEWNCRHIAYPIVLGVSGTANSKEELDEMARYSNEKIEIDGKEYTRYECTQLQRKLETEMRKAQEQKILYKNAGMKDLEREAKANLNLLSHKYKDLSEKAGLPTRMERTRIVKGELAKSSKDAMIKAKTIEECKTVAEVEKLLQSRGWFWKKDVGGFSYDQNAMASLAGCDLESAKGIYKALDRLYTRYPQLEGKLNAIVAKRLDARTYANCTVGLGRGGVKVNTHWFSDSAALSKQYTADLAVGFHPAGTSWDSIVVHEYGHALDDYLTNTLHLAGRQARGKIKWVSADMRPRVLRSCGLKVADINKEVSVYAGKNHFEWFAESFAEYLCSDNPRKAAAAFGKALDKIMEGVT